ncbi:MAG: hypothetical protein OXF25_10210 [Cyanobacteria bacterium MAG CAR3_bin_5]|nr:hypothetical protein [Cyanobacteria bacterium MAG CAR3_bin_5]
MIQRNPPERILLVEGYDDKHFVKHFCGKILDDKLICKFCDEHRRHENHNDKSVFYVASGDRKTGGFNQMIDRAMEEITQQDREALGIIGDAKEALTWRSLIKSRKHKSMHG